jgi:hypothetical protein
MRPQPLICVRDVEASSRWYQRLLDCVSAHGGPNYDRLVASGQLVLQLHRCETGYATHRVLMWDFLRWSRLCVFPNLE